LVLLNRRQVIADRVTEVESGIRTMADAADTRHNGVKKTVGTAQVFETI
jgi:hypothetical protein